MGRITTNFNVGRVHVPIVGLGQSIGAVCTGARDGATSVFITEEAQHETKDYYTHTRYSQAPY